MQLTSCGKLLWLDEAQRSTNAGSSQMWPFLQRNKHLCFIENCYY